VKASDLFIKALENEGGIICKSLDRDIEGGTLQYRLLVTTVIHTEKKMALAKKVQHRVIPIKNFSSCSYCSVRRLCLPVSVDKEEINLIDEMVEDRPQLKKGDYLFHTGEKFNSLFALKSGAMKTYGSTRDGREQITGFHFAGELIGLDAIGNKMHNCNAVALDNTVVCELPYKNIENTSLQMPTLQQEITRLMSLEIRNDEEMLMAIGSMRAEQRVACFLFSLHRRMTLRLQNKSEFRLPMTREEIGNYLGLSLETVSRRMRSLHDDGIIEVDNGVIKLIDVKRLHEMCG
jgi:CRP/FNR family transcriptional regulator